MNEREQFKLVPIEPTEVQIQAGCVNQSTNGAISYEVWAATHSNEIVKKIRGWVTSDYKAMLEAAPSQPAQEPVAWMAIETQRGFEGENPYKEKTMALHHASYIVSNIYPLFTTPQSEAARIAELDTDLLNQLLTYKLKIMPDVDGDVHYVSCSIRTSISPHERISSHDYFYKANDMTRCKSKTLYEAANEAMKELAEALQAIADKG